MRRAVATVLLLSARKARGARYQQGKVARCDHSRLRLTTDFGVSAGTDPASGGRSGRASNRRA